MSAGSATQVTQVTQVTEVTFIRKLKRPDGNGLWPAYHIGADRFGSWLFTPRGSRYRGEKAGVASYCNVGSPVGPGLAVLHLVPVTGWWIATFPDRDGDGDGGRWRVTVDICTPPRLDGGVWTYTDLELDIHAAAGTGEVEIVDEDEFAVACDRGYIPAAEAAGARQAADEVVRLIRGAHEPFSQVGPRKLSQALGLGLPPMRHFP
ncbi:MAG TPA: DUF402 domain-containing protein [Streptosporangiaceae bacterium]